MTETDKRIYRSTVRYELATYREFMVGMRNMLPYTMIVQAIILYYLADQMVAILFSGYYMGFLCSAAVLLITYLVVKLSWRNGGIQYKQLLGTNDGRTPHYCLTIFEGAIHAENMDNGNKEVYRFDKIRGIGETKNLILVLLEYRLGILIDKRTLTGGTADDLTQELLTSCLNLKKRKVQTGKGGHIRFYVIVALLLVGLLLTVFQMASGGAAFVMYHAA